MQFNRNEIIVPHSSRYPDGALVVDGYDDVGRLLAHPFGGGFQFVIGTDKQAQLRLVPAEEQKNPSVRRAQFSLNGVDGQFHGWTTGESWNGWAKPMFELQEARRVIAAMPELKGRYAASDDRFITSGQDGEEESWNAESIQPDVGSTVKVYPVGAGCWCWDEIPEN